MSPHLRIYKPQITSILSIFHRVTGIVLLLATYFFILWTAFLRTGPIGISSCLFFADVVDFVDLPFGPVLLDIALWATAHFIVFSFFYHFCNGIRHLIWDWSPSRTLTNAEIARSGLIMLGVSSLLSILFWLV